jgi:hypothetical protein
MRAASDAPELQQWGFQQDEAIKEGKPFPRVDQVTGFETEPRPESTAFPLDRMEKLKGAEGIPGVSNSLVMTKQQVASVNQYTSSRGSFHPGSLGGFAGVSALHVDDDSAIEDTKRTRQKSKTKQRSKRDKSAARANEAASGRAAQIPQAFDVSEYDQAAYALPHQADSKKQPRKKNRKVIEDAEASQESTKLPLLPQCHPSRVDYTRDDLSKVSGLTNFYDSQQRSTKTHKQQMFANQTKARTRILLPYDREDMTAERDRETAASADQTPDQMAKTISKLPHPSQEASTASKTHDTRGTALNAMAIYQPSIYAMSSEGAALRTYIESP